MDICFLPEPKNVRVRDGLFQIPRKGYLAAACAEMIPAAQDARPLFRNHTVALCAKGVADSLTLTLKKSLKPGGYNLKIDEKGVAIEARDSEAARNAVRTLAQVAQQSPSRALRQLTIRDWPDFQERGLYYDICRGRVPTLDSLKNQAETLARFKINQLQYYIKHTFEFRGHQEIGKNCGSLTAEEILNIDDRCHELGIEFVPSLPSFGHMDRVLEHPRYHAMAEDRGRGEYVEKKGDILWGRTSWSISPAHPDTYDFLESLWAEFLPLFRSTRFNICCDETYDFGWGQSHALCQEKGKGQAYLDHILRLREIAAKHGKTIMFWSDIIHRYPELIPEIPADVTALDWGYEHDHPFKQIARFKTVGCDFIACPGASGWRCLFPQLHKSTANISRYAAAGKRHGASGLLNTDWGDGGHYNFMEFSWYGYLFGAEKAWNVKADETTFAERFCRLFLGVDAPDLAEAIRAFGDLSTEHWEKVFFARPNDPILTTTEPVTAINRHWEKTTIPNDEKSARAIAEKLDNVRQVFARHARDRRVDPEGVLPYWIFAVDTIRHAARKQATFGPDGRQLSADRKALKREFTDLMKRFETLWMARNKRSEIRTTLKRYRAVLATL